MPSFRLEIGWAVLVAALLAGGVWAVGALQRIRAKHRLLPPGPPSGFFGTKIPQPYAWRQFEKWTHQFGDLHTVWLSPTKPLVVIGTYAAGMRIMEREGSGVMADRPRSIMAGETMAGDMRLLFIRYGDRWRRARKIMHQGLQPKAAASYEPIQEQAARVFLQDILAEPDSFQDHSHKYAASVIMSITYGKTTPTKYSDPEVMAVAECLSRVAVWARPGAALVDSYPILRHFPGKWKTNGRKWHEQEKALFVGQLEQVRQDMKEGRGVDCFARFVIEHQKEYQLNDAEAAYICGSLFGAGSDTTASALTIAIMAMAMYPEKVRIAQQELDKFVGRDRAPNFNDEPELPYCQAFVNEVHRWRPVSTGGFLHAALDDFAYGPYVIPKGASVVANHWSISRDPAVFPRAEEFRPERWFEGEDCSAKLRKDITYAQFGWGRRVCAGKNVAVRSVWINTALLLWAFNFSKKKDAAGKEIPIDTLAFTNAANSHPLPFKCEITPRFDRVAKVLAGETE